MPYANRLVILREPATEHMNCITAHVKWAIRLYQQPGVGQLCTGHRTRHVDRSLKGADFKLWGEGCHGAGTFTSRFQSVRGVVVFSLALSIQQLAVVGELLVNRTLDNVDPQGSGGEISPGAHVS